MVIHLRRAVSKAALSHAHRDIYVQVQHAVLNLRAQQCTKPAVLQQIRLEEACKELAALDKKATDNKAKEKYAEAEVTKLADELDNLPPMPQGNAERKRSLLSQRQDLNLQVCRPVANFASMQGWCFAGG